jgi:hypothetical protein
LLIFPQVKIRESIPSGMQKKKIVLYSMVKKLIVGKTDKNEEIVISGNEEFTSLSIIYIFRVV